MLPQEPDASKISPQANSPAYTYSARPLAEDIYLVCTFKIDLNQFIKN